MSDLVMSDTTRYAHISIAQQTITLWQDDDVYAKFSVNTAKNGVGQQKGSECTPIGAHYIRARIGEGLDPLAVLRARRPTGEVWSPELSLQYPDRDWILGRILWLCGREQGVNRGKNVDTFHRYIYMHASPDTESWENPSSHGCIRLHPTDMITTFEFLHAGDNVDIFA